MEFTHLSEIAICVIFASLTISGTSPCTFPKGFYKGMCVICPANTLYMYNVLKSQHSQSVCDEKCSGLRPVISGRLCKETCEKGNKERQRGNIRYCRDRHLNKGFCPFNTCPSAYVCYYMKCFLKCPFFTVQYDNSCLIECFEDRPLVHDGMCVRECPSEENIIENGLCLRKCSDGRYLSGNICVEACLEEQYIEGNTCVSNCSAFSKLDGRYCVQNCSINRYVSGNKCVKHCPEGQYVYEKQCIESCPNNTVIEENKCLSQCSNGRFLSETYCVINCPDTHFINKTNDVCTEQCNDGYLLQNGSLRFCLQSCPYLSVQINSTCEKDCPVGEPFYFNGSCLEKCPNSSSSISRELSPFDALLYRCVASCSKYVSLNNLCVDVCQPNEVLYANTCLLHCPKSDPLQVYLPVNYGGKVNITSSYIINEPISAFAVCASKCPQHFLMDSGKCYADCLNSSRRMIHNSTCLEMCPNDHPYMTKNGNNFICSSSCPHRRFHANCVENCPRSHQSVYENECVNCAEIGMIERGNECVFECENFLYRSKCYDSCPLGAQFMYNKTCFRTCPDNFSFVDEQNFGKYKVYVCVNTCPEYKYVFANQCVLKCPENKRFHIDGKCISCQDIGQLDNGTKCVEFCQDIVYNFQCIKRCPYNTILYNKSCVMNCPSNMPAQLYDYVKGSYCAAKCPHGMFLFNSRCTYDCLYPRRYVYNDVCLNNCPPQAPYSRNIVRKYGIPLHQCLEVCEQGEVKLNTVCYKSCPANYHLHEGNCLLNCPGEAPLKYRGHCVKNCSHYKLGLNCYNDCPSNLYRDNGTCVVICPVDRPYEYHRNCTENCKNNTYKREKSCYDTCPPGSFGYRDKCMLNCPTEAKYSYSGLCKEKCPNTTITFNNSCISKCPGTKVEYQGRCVDTCPKNASYIKERTCVSSCPNVRYKKNCFEVCPHNMKVYENECLETCPQHSRFTKNKKCVEECPSFHMKLNCIDNCPKNTYPHGKECKSDCPKEKPFLKNSIFSRRTCLASCDILELAAENMTCIYEFNCKGFIDDFWCRKKCLSNTYILYSKDEKHCKSLYPVYVWTGICLLTIVADIAFGIKVMIYSRRRLKERGNEKIEELDLGKINIAFDNYED